ncbi:Zinc knuckle domain-containing protein [Aspergillus sclerotialis]|uniref:Zinc knuckle domain-containing protein n=1 Tax=Aspergillus sclerotialis TaxID=2070753 RepID=A0A3A2Z9K3_9EURO|nr:Zinc knuckle domain-containing protein [Aspergillus sclerotialis]
MPRTRLAIVPKRVTLLGQGHVSRECTLAPKPKSCYRCGAAGHISRECTQAGSGDFGNAGGAQECYKCGKVGHIARNCSQGGFGGGFGGRHQTCYSCGGFGHMARDCTQGQKCYNC